MQNTNNQQKEIFFIKKSNKLDLEKFAVYTTCKYATRWSDKTGDAMGNLFNRKDVIYAIYQEKSFSKAAQKLFVSQPSLSAMVKKIEDEVGTALFDRTSKPIRMTEAGTEYIKAAEAIERIEQGFETYLSAYQDLQTGSLKLGSNQLISSLVLPKYISAFVSRYPNIELHLVDDNSVSLENMINEGELDFVIDNQTLDAEIFSQKLLKTEQLLMAVPENFTCNALLKDYQLTYADIMENRHWLQDIPAPPLKVFDDVPYVTMTKDNETRHRSDEILRKANVKVKRILEIDRLVTLYNFVEMGTAAAVVSDTLVQNIQHHFDNVVFYRLDSPLAFRNIYISCKHNKFYSRAMEAFVALVMEMTNQSGL